MKKPTRLQWLTFHLWMVRAVAIIALVALCVFILMIPRLSAAYTLTAEPTRLSTFLLIIREGEDPTQWGGDCLPRSTRACSRREIYPQVPGKTNIDGKCEIIVPVVERGMTEAEVRDSWWHELRHCVEGDWHD